MKIEGQSLFQRKKKHHVPVAGERKENQKIRKRYASQGAKAAELNLWDVPFRELASKNYLSMSINYQGAPGVQNTGKLKVSSS
jgi:hypothetical protein